MGSKDGVQAEWGTELWGRSGQHRLLRLIVLWRAKVHWSDLKRPTNSSVTITHFNLTFEVLLEVVVTLKEGVLEPAKHSTIVFMESNHPNLFESADDDRAEVLGNDDSTSKGQIAGGKVGAGRNSRKLNKKKRDRESHFKMSSSS
ncbi:hypothetical protein Gotri_019278 [Gossypium trilobum]|uniref:Uncharacterized protein n=1 Tax=Gossypium trilobum TaxID=34281 RepID=A0A7J9ED28_9ROSI|nr:hypothetical protein [Gossypium trilobum]